MTGKLLLVSALASCAFVACTRPGSSAHGPGATSAFVAVVSGDGIDVATVSRIATERGITAAAATDVAVSDALFAAAGRERLGAVASRQVERSALGRAVLESIESEATHEGPPTDAEVDEATRGRWWELDQPPLLRTTHVAVLVKKPEDDRGAHALADRIAEKVRGISDPAAFRAAASEVPSSTFEVRVEDLDPVAEDGRSVDPNKPPPPGSKTAEFSHDFTKAAFAIPEVGAESPVVRTEFGYHVILAVEMIPAHRVALEDRRRLLEAEIVERRASKRRDDLLEAARKVDHVDVERSALDTAGFVKASQ